MCAVDPDRYRAIELEITDDTPKDQLLRRFKCSYRSFNAVLENNCKVQFDHLFPLSNFATSGEDLTNWTSKLEGSSLEKSAENEFDLVQKLANRQAKLDLHVVNVVDQKHDKDPVCATTIWTLLTGVYDVPMYNQAGRGPELDQLCSLAEIAYGDLRQALHERRSKRQSRQVLVQLGIAVTPGCEAHHPEELLVEHSMEMVEKTKTDTLIMTIPSCAPLFKKYGYSIEGDVKQITAEKRHKKEGPETAWFRNHVFPFQICFMSKTAEESSSKATA